MIGLTLGSQLKETGLGVAAAGSDVASQAGRLTGHLLDGLANGLLKASDAISKRRF